MQPAECRKKVSADVSFRIAIVVKIYELKNSNAKINGSDGDRL